MAVTHSTRTVTDSLTDGQPDSVSLILTRTMTVTESPTLMSSLPEPVQRQLTLTVTEHPTAMKSPEDLILQMRTASHYRQQSLITTLKETLHPL